MQISTDGEYFNVDFSCSDPRRYDTDFFFSRTEQIWGYVPLFVFSFARHIGYRKLTVIRSRPSSITEHLPEYVAKNVDRFQWKRHDSEVRRRGYRGYRTWQKMLSISKWKTKKRRGGGPNQNTVREGEQSTYHPKNLCTISNKLIRNRNTDTDEEVV